MSSEYTDQKFIKLAEKMNSEKTKGSENFMKNDYESAIINYKNGIDIGYKFFENLKVNLIENEYYQQLKTELKFCFSNLASVYLKMNKHKEIIYLDKIIIRVIDNKFDKSYARLIMSYWSLSDIGNATKLYYEFLQTFTNEQIEEEIN